jgi:hypothetical protein
MPAVLPESELISGTSFLSYASFAWGGTLRGAIGAEDPGEDFVDIS